MVRDDIIAGLKNAIERGYSLEQAKYSFISAGYNLEEVEEASKFVYSGSALVQEKQETMPKPAEAVQPAIPSVKLEKPATVAVKPRRNWKVILLIAILAILVAFLILTLIFREKIISWFT